MTYQIVSERKLKNTIKIATPEEAYCFIRRYAKAKQEHFILLTLNGTNNVISVSIVSIGTANKTVIHPREVFCKAITDRATSIIVCHNHPSGVVTPSSEDRKVTEDLYQAGQIIGIPLIDHIVFSKNSYTSLRSQGFIPQDRE